MIAIERSCTRTLYSRCGGFKSGRSEIIADIWDRVLLEGVQSMEVSVNPANQGRWNIVMGSPGQIEGEIFPADLADAVRGLWHDDGVRAVFARRNELQLNDSAP